MRKKKQDVRVPGRCRASASCSHFRICCFTGHRYSLTVVPHPFPNVAVPLVMKLQGENRNTEYLYHAVSENYSCPGGVLLLFCWLFFVFLCLFSWLLFCFFSLFFFFFLKDDGSVEGLELF